VGRDNENRFLPVNTTKKISVWMLGPLVLAWTAFPSWSDGDYFRLGVLLAALGTLALWVSLVILFSWIFSACGSITRLRRKNNRQASVRWRNRTLA
jgi:hypothetical protein